MKRLVSFGFFLDLHIALILVHIFFSSSYSFFSGLGSVNSFLICTEFFIKFH